MNSRTQAQAETPSPHRNPVPHRNLDKMPEEIQDAILVKFPRDHLSITSGDTLKVVETDSIPYLKDNGFPISHLPKKPVVVVGIQVPWRWGTKRLLSALR